MEVTAYSEHTFRSHIFKSAPLDLSTLAAWPTITSVVPFVTLAHPLRYPVGAVIEHHPGNRKAERTCGDQSAQGDTIQIAYGLATLPIVLLALVIHIVD